MTKRTQLRIAHDAGAKAADQLEAALRPFFESSPSLFPVSRVEDMGLSAKLKMAADLLNLFEEVEP